MSKLVYGFNAHRLRQVTQPDEFIATPLSAADLRAIGVAEHKIPRVQEEIARLVLQDNRLLDRQTLANLALELEKQFK